MELQNRGIFDELVVDHWLHVEQMDTRDWWASIGDVYVWVHIRRDGTVQVNVRRGEYGEADGMTEYGSTCVRHEPKGGRARFVEVFSELGRCK